MNFRERILNTFKKEKIDKIVWQPRLEHWYNVNKSLGRLSEKYQNMGILELYDDLNASVRYYNSPLKTKYKKVEIDINIIEEKTIITYKTPVGDLQQVIFTSEIDLSSHLIEYPLYYPLSPLQRLILDYAGFERTIYFLNDYPEKIKKFLKIIEKSDDQLYDVLTKSPVEILNFGENIDSNLNSPHLFEEYFIPYYEKRVEQLHKAGKFCHIHMDGSLKTLLPYLERLKFDGIEAATPLPQGDVTLEELKSDELSPLGDIEKVRFVSKILENYKR
jgi:hypothetical protein